MTPDQLLAAATEFTFRPDYGHLNRLFSDDPEGRDAVTVSYRGPSEPGTDPDRWAILRDERWCWSRSKGAFGYEPRPSSRSDDFLADHRFSRAEALALVPAILRKIESERIPQLRRQVQKRAKRKAETQ